MKNIAIIYPNQLFELDYLPYNINDIDFFIIIEDSLYFRDTERKLNFNMLKLIYQRACMKYYENYLLDNKLDVVYLNWDKNADNLFYFIKENYGLDNNLYIIDPVDNLLSERINKFSKKFNQNTIFHDTPGFLLSRNELEDYYNSTNENKRFSQRNFYIWYRKKFNILMDQNKPLGGKYSYDKFNRNSVPGKNLKNFILDNDIVSSFKPYDSELYEEAINYCEKTFENYYPNNYDPNNIYLYPITHVDSKKNFQNFLENKLRYFGEYQDAIDFNQVYMFHSVISSQQNIGLLIPQWVIDNTINNFNNSNDDILYDTEAYIRQLIWREYSRLLYTYVDEQMRGNYFDNDRKITLQWYDGETGIIPVDTAIKTAFKYGYIHHIIRLMIMCNFMNLCRIHPDDIYKWFMEFSLDSYDWVMSNNVYSMGLYADGGLTTSKPYISSSSYVLKMSNAKKDGYWNVMWNVLYYNFIAENYDKLHGRGKIYQSHWDRQRNKEEIKKNAKKFINSVTE
ncbi:deoxyribodipyrimidine photolyase-related protein [Moumouvirus australiensis]|uniref:Deoxyribodipyrimidine photolyase-related protein n=1 Tax=Moumouvirus australiensis TaxID=2109587 RepID=A0A2P1EME5_9VIRU|nr:deoxyribodipyrimidine photolyase-related protein [Moumouvirus australiensis]AVL95075.1 deoxyribodipyrimidine photolyase-related protein [Moumouvirus australiensis]